MININLGQSSDPDVEQEVLSDVGTQGKQIGRIGDALTVLLRRGIHACVHKSVTSQASSL